MLVQMNIIMEKEFQGKNSKLLSLVTTILLQSEPKYFTPHLKRNGIFWQEYGGLNVEKIKINVDTLM